MVLQAKHNNSCNSAWQFGASFCVFEFRLRSKEHKNAKIAGPVFSNILTDQNEFWYDVAMCKSYE